MSGGRRYSRTQAPIDSVYPPCRRCQSFRRSRPKRHQGAGAGRWLDPAVGDRASLWSRRRLRSRELKSVARERPPRNGTGRYVAHVPRPHALVEVCSTRVSIDAQHGQAQRADGAEEISKKPPPNASTDEGQIDEEEPHFADPFVALPRGRSGPRLHDPASEPERRRGTGRGVGCHGHRDRLADECMPSSDHADERRSGTTASCPAAGDLVTLNSRAGYTSTRADAPSSAPRHNGPPGARPSRRP
jgi:hypothetical protein